VTDLAQWLRGDTFEPWARERRALSLAIARLGCPSHPLGIGGHCLVPGHMPLHAANETRFNERPERA
jgi:hypothetical protein